MNHRNALNRLVPLIGALALFAAAAGLFDPTPGTPTPYTNHRGETVLLNGRGLYRFDTISSAAQMQGNDAITLAIGLPLLAAAAWLTARGSLRGQLLLTGTLGFFLYTYLSMSMLTAYNALFLVYVALFSLSLFAFILSLMSFDLAGLPARFSQRLPRGWIAGAMFVTAGFLALAWLQRILAPLLSGQTPALDNTTTLVIQAMDLGLIVPLAALAGWQLLRRSAWGYLLASVFLTKSVTLGLAVCTMVVFMARAGTAESLGIAVPFFVITAVNLVMTGVLLAHVDRADPRAAIEPARA